MFEQKPIKIDMSKEKAEDYVCCKCKEPLVTTDLHIKQPEMLMGYCVNSDCPVKRVKISTVG